MKTYILYSSDRVNIGVEKITDTGCRVTNTTKFRSKHKSLLVYNYYILPVRVFSMNKILMKTMWNKNNKTRLYVIIFDNKTQTQ